MKKKDIVLNIILTLGWSLYYYLTMHTKEFFIMGIDEQIFFFLIVCFSVYNIFALKWWQFVVKNALLGANLCICCCIAWCLHLHFCPHMSDEHDALPIIIAAVVIELVVISAIVCLIKVLLLKIKK